MLSELERPVASKQRGQNGRTKLDQFWNRPTEPLSTAFDPRSNSIGLLRTVFALLVILSHSFPLGSLGIDWVVRFGQGQEVIGGVAVRGFFVLSGYLIATSYLKSDSIVRYLWQRALRVMPGFWVALLVVAFGFAPLMYWLQNDNSLSGFSLNSPTGPIDYIKSNFFLTMKQYEISGLTANLPAPGAFNGSLWTLLYEAKAYLVLGVLGFFGILKNRRELVLGGSLLLFALHLLGKVAPGGITNLSPRFSDPQLITLLMSFMIGAVFRLYHEKIPIENRLGILAILVYLASLRYHFYEMSSPFIYTYVLLYLAVRLPFKKFGSRADLSYGIYIYAFPVQQTLAQLKFQRHGIYIFTALSALLTIPLAFASYFIVEKPFLRLKNIGSGAPRSTAPGSGRSEVGSQQMAP